MSLLNKAPYKSKLSDTSFKDTIRGGQIFMHNIRMINQVFRDILITVVIVIALFNAGWFFYKTDSYDKYAVLSWISAEINLLTKGQQATQSFREPTGFVHPVYSKQLIQSKTLQFFIKRFLNECLIGLKYSCLVGLLTFFISLIWLKKYGAEQTKPLWRRGIRLIEAKTLTHLLKKQKKASYFTIGNVPIAKDSETQHILIHGTVGTGKSVSIKELLQKVRDKGQRAVIYDKGCDFIQYFYRDGKDYLLNPLDIRTQPWNIWAECSDPADYDNFAAAFMPLPAIAASDPFWINAARTIFACTAQKLAEKNIRSTSTLLRYLFSTELKELFDLVKGTEAEVLVSDKAEKTALNVKSVLANFLKSLKYLTDDENVFSIRKWIQEDSDSWLFITSRGDKHETLKPLISAWLNTVATSTLSLTPSPERRIWLFLDELPSLHRLPYLPEAFAEARKFGGCLVAGMQSVEQLKKIYGEHEGIGMIDLCNTRLFLRNTESKIAHWVSQNLSEYEIDEVKEGLSYGANSFKDGVSVSTQNIRKPVVSSTEIEALNDLEGYLRLKGDWPITKVKLTPKPITKIAEGFIPREFVNEAFIENVSDLKTESLSRTSTHSVTLNMDALPDGF